MAFQVPEMHVEHLRELLKLPEEKLDELIAALEDAAPQFNFADLAGQLSAVGLRYGLTVGIMHVLVSLYRTGDSLKEIDRFLDGGVRPSLRRAGLFTAEDENFEWQKLRKFFVSALSIEGSVGTAAKAGPILTDHERIFHSARIMTDLRPIYHLDVSEQPDAALIIHMLKITQRDQHGNKSDLFFALDSNDIATMKEIVERAEKKEITLRSLMENTGITVLRTKATY